MNKLAKFFLLGLVLASTSCLHSAVVRPISTALPAWSHEYCDIRVETSGSLYTGLTGNSTIRVTKLSVLTETKVLIYGEENGLIRWPAIHTMQLKDGQKESSVPWVPRFESWLWVEVRHTNTEPCFFKMMLRK